MIILLHYNAPEGSVTRDCGDNHVTVRDRVPSRLLYQGSADVVIVLYEVKPLRRDRGTDQARSPFDDHPAGLAACVAINHHQVRALRHFFGGRWSEFIAQSAPNPLNRIGSFDPGGICCRPRHFHCQQLVQRDMVGALDLRLATERLITSLLDLRLAMSVWSAGGLDWRHLI